MTSTVYVDVFLYIYFIIIIIIIILGGGWEAGTVCSLGGKRDDAQISSKFFSRCSIMETIF